jgi:hypothetical protein
MKLRVVKSSRGYHIQQRSFFVWYYVRVCGGYTTFISVAKTYKTETEAINTALNYKSREVMTVVWEDET